MDAVLRKGYADLRRRPVRAAAALLTACLAAATAAVALALLATGQAGVTRAFGCLALAAGAAVVIDLVTGRVLAARAELGALRAIGCTPVEAVAAVALQALAPVAAGCEAGAIAGSLLARPLLADAFGLAPAPVLPVALAVAGAGLAVVAGTGVPPALRAGLRSPARAIEEGPVRRGRARGARLGSLLPRPVRMGAGGAFAQPARATVTVATVMAGVAAAVLALWLPATPLAAAGLAAAPLAGVLLTLLHHARERGQDMAVLRAVGMTPVQVLATLVTSAAALAAIGAVPGLTAGVVIHHVVAPSPRALRLSEMALVPAGALLAAVLAAVIAGRRADARPIAQALHRD
jgi:putative ABC transport system permease protein